MEPVTTDEATADHDERIEWRSVARGALVGFAVIVPVTIIQAALQHELTDYDRSGWRYPLFVLILVALFSAGWWSARGRVDEPYTYGILGAAGAFALLIPTRVVIWAMREDDRGLVLGSKAVLRPGQVVGDLVIAAGLGALGGWLSARRTRKAANRSG